jgi:hypothetical protein
MARSLSLHCGATSRVAEGAKVGLNRDKGASGWGGGAAEESRKEKEWHQLKRTEMGPYDCPIEDDA